MRSGFCNPTLPRTPTYDPHANCHALWCTCPHHTEDPMPIHIDPDVMQAAAAGILTPTHPTTPQETVTHAQHAATAVNEALAGYEPDDWRDGVRILHQLRVAIGTLRDVEAAMVRWVYLHGEHGLHQTVDGVPGEVNITRGRAKERWAAEDAVKAYVEAQLAETGEVPDPLQVMAWVLEVLPATQSTSLRKTPLRKAGLDLEDFYWSEPGSLSVSTPT